MRRTAIALSVGVFLLLAPQAAFAGDLYVQGGGTDPGCISAAAPCGTLGYAVGLANAASTATTIHVLGPLSETPSSPLVVGGASPVTIEGSGAGSGGTLIQPPGATPAVTLQGGSSLHNLAIKAPHVGVLAYGGIPTSTALDGVSIATTSTTDPAVSIIPIIGALKISGSTISAPDNSSARALSANLGPGQTLSVADSTISGAQGVSISSTPGPGSADIERSAIDAVYSGLLVSGSTATVSDSVIHTTGDGASAAYAAAGSFIGSTPGTITLIQDTLESHEASVATRGVVADAGLPPLGSPGGVVNVFGTVVRGYGYDLDSHASTPTGVGTFPGGAGTINVASSDYRAAAREPSPVGGPGQTPGHTGVINDIGHNTNADPGFVDASSGDYRLRSDSALIDAAGTTPLGTLASPFNGTESPTDRLGNPRIVDGNADGTAARDIGAFEYQYARPSAALDVTPNPVVAGQPVVLDASRSTYGVGPIADYRFDLDGSGRFATEAWTNPRLMTTFAQPGVYPVAVEVTGFDGAISKTTGLITVVAAPPAPNSPSHFTGIKLSTGNLSSNPNGVITVTVACPSTASSFCKGGINLQTVGKFLLHSAAHRQSKKKVVNLGHGNFSIAPGRSTTVKIHLSRAELALLRRVHKLKILVTATVRDASGHVVVTRESVTLKLAKPRRHKHH